MAYNAQTDHNHYHVYDAHTVKEGRNEYYHEIVDMNKVAVIAIPCYGASKELDLIKAALLAQNVDASDIYGNDSGFLTDSSGDAVFYIDL
jgi:hypothetical protein